MRRFVCVMLLCVSGCDSGNDPAPPRDGATLKDGFAAKNKTDPNPADPLAAGPAATPEEAVRQWTAAAASRDLNRYLETLAAPQRAMVRLELDADRARRDLEKALEAKFGRDPEGSPAGADPLERTSRIERFEILANVAKGSDRFDLKLKAEVRDGAGGRKSQEISLAAVKEGTAWKVAPADIGNPDTDKQQTQDLERIIRAAPRIAREVGEGKFAGRDAALLAFAGALTEP